MARRAGRGSIPHTWLALHLLLVAAGPVTGQVLTVQNLAPMARREWACAAVPFARGATKAAPKLHVAGVPTIWQPFGARWPDGSWRQALCFFPVEIDRLAEQRLKLEPGKGPLLPKIEWLPPKVELTVVLQQGERELSARPVFVRHLEQNPARWVALHRCRIGNSGLVCEMILATYVGQEHQEIDLAVFFSDPTTKDMMRHVDLLQVRTKGMQLNLRHARRTGVSIEHVAGGSQVTLLKNTHLADGQGVRRTGVLVPALKGDGSLRDRTLQAATVCPLLAATRWNDSGAFGPVGYVPALPPWLSERSVRGAMARRHARFVQSSKHAGGPFHNFGLGLAKFAGQSGSQADFGVVKLTPVATTGLPSFLLEVELSVLQEACRPVHFLERDGSPVEVRNHPEWRVWTGRTHWHGSVSKDRLGKPCPEPKYDTHGWTGKDRQHWSSNYLCAFYLLTGKHWALREIQNEVRLFMAGQLVDSGTPVDDSGAPRGAGRAMMAGCWLYLCTGDPALLQRLHDRMSKVHKKSWYGARFGADKVRPMALHGPDRRYLGDKKVWLPWQDHLAALGFAAFWRMTGNEDARMLAEALAMNAVRYGWHVFPDGPLTAYGMQWNSDGGLAMWSVPAVEVARQAAKQRGDGKLEARATMLLELLRRGRRPRRDGWFDDFGDWDAFR
ncbi:MAG: hypothetical protein ACYTKC_20515 [Planctomycetota bacterium]|jgi:hypothetical protein